MYNLGILLAVKKLTTDKSTKARAKTILKFIVELCWLSL